MFFTKKISQSLLPFLIVGLMIGCSSVGSKTETSSADGTRKVGRVMWNKAEKASAEEIAKKAIPANNIGLFFFRPMDKDGFQTSANVAVNGRFQVSLQPGHFSHVYSCSGINDLSVDITGYKHNDLRKGLASYNLKAGQNYYFGVDVSSKGVLLKKLSDKVALKGMRAMSRQSHQMSRVTPNCAKGPTGPTRLELKVLFDSGKAQVKKDYYAEIKRVADYMQKNPKVTAIIEGHTDSQASEEHNKKLSQRRVVEVLKVLVRRYGINAKRLKAIGYGESRPIASNDTEEGRAKNRRVIAVFSQ
ncbi:MAG: OmpA family protein [Gammaproteobacteria bacterium]|nr:OmpA family protein [Gammaproteobacteria bacterium]